MCDHTCYNICRHEDREDQLRFRPKLARRMIAALIAALIAGLVSGPADIQAGLEPGGHVGASQVSRPPAVATPKIEARPSSAVPDQQVVLLGSGFSNITVAGGTLSDGRHQITGTGSSTVTTGGTVLQAPYITYPIDLDNGGNWVAQIIIEGNSATFGTTTCNLWPRTPVAHRPPPACH